MDNNDVIERTIIVYYADMKFIRKEILGYIIKDLSISMRGTF